MGPALWHQGPQTLRLVLSRAYKIDFCCISVFVDILYVRIMCIVYQFVTLIPEANIARTHATYEERRSEPAFFLPSFLPSFRIKGGKLS